MAPEMIHFKDHSQSAGPQADWNRALTSNRVISSVDVNSWAIFFIKQNQADVNNFVKCYMQCAPQLGIRVNQPEMIILPNDKVETVVQALRTAINPRVCGKHSLSTFFLFSHVL